MRRGGLLAAINATVERTTRLRLPEGQRRGRLPNRDKLLVRARRNPTGLRFAEFVSLIEACGFIRRRITGIISSMGETMC